MISRFHLTCSGCGAIIALRIALGLDNTIPFQFKCEGCLQPISGELAINSKRIRNSRLQKLVGAAKT